MGATSHPRRHHHAAGKEGMRACWFVLLPWIETKLLSPTQKSLRSSSTCERATAMNVIALQRDLEAQDADAPLRARGAWRRSHPAGVAAIHDISERSWQQRFPHLSHSISRPSSVFTSPLSALMQRARVRACGVRKATPRWVQARHARAAPRARRRTVLFLRIAIAPARAAITDLSGAARRPGLDSAATR